MTTQILEQQIAAMSRVLADATEACQGWDTPEGKIPCGAVPHQDCQGTGHVARFPGFRQECCCTERGTPGYLWAGASVAHANCPLGTEPCSYCEGHTGWQVRAGGLDGALVGLNRGEANDWLSLFGKWVNWKIAQSPMPSAHEILAKSLELVIKVAGLEVPDAN